MASRKPTRREYEDRERGSNAPLLIVIAVALFGLALLLVYLCFAEPQPGTAMGAIRDVMRGLGGDVSVFLPLFLIWIGALCAFKAGGRRLSPLRIAADVLLFLCLFAAVHIFFVERVLDGLDLGIEYYSNFVIWSFKKGVGGGFLGALLSGVLYRYLGPTAGFFGIVLIVVLLLTATGRLSRMANWINARQEARDKNEQEFDYERGDRRETHAALRSGRQRDPYSEAVWGGAGVPAEEQLRKSSRRKAAASARDGAEARKAGRARAEESDARPTRGKGARAATATPTRKPATAKRGRLYREDVGKAKKDDLFDGFDDFDRLEAESEAYDAAQKGGKARRAFTPDRPTAMKSRDGRIEDVVEDAPGRAPMAATRENNVTIDDLTIEPDAYETPDDDAPFDLPSAPKQGAAKAGTAEKKEYPKLKRAKPQAEEPPAYNYPPIDLLGAGTGEDTTNHARRDREKAQLLEETLQSFGISSKLIGIAHGPAVTRFELQPAPGVKVSRITSLADDIALNLAAMSVRIEAPIPGKAAVGVEIPNDKIEMVRLRDVLESPDARKHASKIAVGLGKDNSGRYIVADIAKMPHVLIAGQTGSGKSVCINAIITSILFRAAPDEVKLILIDPKVVELSIYNDIPHLVCPVVTDPKKAASALDWAVAEMSARYKKFAERGVRDIKGYNKALKKGEAKMPQMVIIIDELADLMMVAPGEVEDSICRLAQLARAAGMHLVIATQRPSVNVITGIIKANIPTRIAFSVASQVDSRTMIDHGGAEKLLGNGDMLFVPNGTNKPMRVQGAWVSDEEVHAIVEYIKQSGENQYDQDMIEHLENAVRSDAEKEEFQAEYDPRLPEAIDIVIDMGQASISMLQRRMRIGYAKAGRLIDEMTQRGIVSEADGAKPREVLITREQAQAMFEE